MMQAAAVRKTLVVIGNGMVGHYFCTKLVQKNAQHRMQIVVFGEEPRIAYDRVNLTEFFSGRSPKDLELCSIEWYEKNGITLHLGDPIVAIDRNRQVVSSRSGVEVPFDTLVFATGSKPFIPPIDGIDTAGIFPYRTVEDLTAIKDFSRNVKSAAVLGGGLLGLEAAKALYDLGHETHVIEMAPALMPRQLDSDGARLLQKRIEALGVHIHLVKRTQRIEANGATQILHFDHGEPLTVDMVVVSTGIRPRDELANKSGLKIGKPGGIVVDDRLQTSDPNIFAIGECAQHRGVIYGLVAPGYQMADTLAANLTGDQRYFESGDQSARLKLLGVDVATIGEPLGSTQNVQILTSQTEGTFRKLILSKNRVVGALSVGPWSEIERLRQFISSGRRVYSWNLRRFQTNGNLWKTQLSVNDWPDSATVCSCLSVSRGDLRKAQLHGCETVSMLAQKTGASTVCGSCKSLLAELAGVTFARPISRWKGLLAASVVAVCLVLLWCTGPLPISQTVTNEWHRIEHMLRGSIWKQTTGYILVGVSVLALLLPLRKRLPRFSYGGVGFWRTVHSLIGISSIVGLLSHTGLRLGANLNFVLALSFLGLNFFGGLTGIITAWESRATGMTAMTLRNWRPRLSKLHVVFILPLPVLLAFHVACVYYY